MCFQALKTKTAPSSSVQKPVGAGGQKSGTQRNEIFVDILERHVNVLALFGVFCCFRFYSKIKLGFVMTDARDCWWIQ